MVGAIVHGLIHGGNVDEILLRSWVCLVVFSIVGAILGVIAESAIRESIQQRLKEELSNRTQASQVGGMT
jgi:F0F1-type ATP synthase assembly protein I